MEATFSKQLDLNKDKLPKDILLCHNCDWNGEFERYNFYTSCVKCVSVFADIGTWQIGDKYILRERPLIRKNGRKNEPGPEILTTKWVRDNTTIPVAAELHEWRDSESHFLWMSKLPGQILHEAWPKLKTEEKVKYAKEIAEYIAQLRTHTAPKPQTTEGGPVRDWMRICQGKVMFFENKETWWRSMQGLVAERGLDWGEKVKARYPDMEGPYVLSHGNLNTYNITIHDGHVSGIINWERAGYYPKWWEYASAAKYIDELEWARYVTREIGDRFGRFNDELEFSCSFH